MDNYGDKVALLGISDQNRLASESEVSDSVVLAKAGIQDFLIHFYAIR